MIEASTKRMDVLFDYTHEQAVKHHSDPRFKGFKSLHEDLTMSFMSKKRVKMNQLWAVGQVILDTSKRIMFELFYNVIQPAFNNKVSIGKKIFIKRNNTEFSFSYFFSFQLLVTQIHSYS